MKNNFTLYYWIWEVDNKTVFEEFFPFLHFSTIRWEAEIDFLKQAPFNLAKKGLFVCMWLLKFKFSMLKLLI